MCLTRTNYIKPLKNPFQLQVCTVIFTSLYARGGCWRIQRPWLMSFFRRVGKMTLKPNLQRTVPTVRDRIIDNRAAVLIPNTFHSSSRNYCKTWKTSAYNRTWLTGRNVKEIVSAYHNAINTLFKTDSFTKFLFSSFLCISPLNSECFTFL